MKTRKPKTITAIGRRWFERTNGNTYHSTEVYIDGVLLKRVPYEYGYGSQWEQTAQEVLKAAGYDLAYPLSMSCRDKGITYVSSVTDVSRKRDL